MKFKLFIIAQIILADFVYSQDKERSWTLNGYIKDMMSFSVYAGNGHVSNLVHNRLNFKWYVNDQFKFVTEMRNRVFTDKELGINPQYVNLVDRSNDYFDMSHSQKLDNANLLHLMIDRLYLQFNKNKLELKAGRQRINWGINLTWNPNDIFNAYSYFDFDYEERPGSDAVLIRYYTGIASSIEIAAKMADNFDDLTSALLWKTNYNNYDFQILTGISNRNLVLGGGWAGNIKNAGFKGEWTYFHPIENAVDSIETFNISISLDYSFKSSLFLNFSAMYSDNGKIRPNLTDQVLYYSGIISSKYLSPYKWSTFIQSTYQFHPLVNGGLGIIAYPGSRDLFTGPFVAWSLTQNIDLNFFAQILLSDTQSGYGAITELYYLRLKYSF